MSDASFVGTNLRESNLQNADICRAKLVEAQLDGADFSGAVLTGAYLQDCGITPDTKLDGVNCEYIFMRVPTPEEPNPSRQPANWEATFQPGEFARFMKPLSRVSNI